MGIRYAEVIGDPVEHSKSPAIHNFWLRALGREGDYRRTRVIENGLGDYLMTRRDDPLWQGCNVTMPLKQAILPLLGEVNEVVERLGAVNCVTPSSGRLRGTNFDSEAVLQVLLGYAWSGEAVVIGNGGAARAALWALPLLGFDKVTVMSRDPRKAAAMLKHIDVEADIAPLGSTPESALLINATPLGMAGFPPLPVELDRMAGDATVFEMVYNPLVTPLVAAARARGLRVVDGLTLLIEQAAMSFVSFFGGAVDQSDRIAVREALTR
jgi:shikimate dehydrogenase